MAELEEKPVHTAHATALDIKQRPLAIDRCLSAAGQCEEEDSPVSQLVSQWVAAG